MDTRTNPSLTRQAIVNAQGDLIGYHLSSAHQGAASGEPSQRPADLRRLSEALNEVGPSQVLAGRPAFVKVDGPTLKDTAAFALLTPARTVLCLTPDIRPERDTLSRLDALRSLGFGVSAQVRPSMGEQAASAWFSVASHLTVDARHLQSDDAHCEVFVPRLRYQEQTLIAQAVDSPALAQRSLELGFQGITGRHAGELESAGSVCLAINHAGVRRAIVELQAGATVESLEPIFRRDIALCWRLLRYVASSNFGMLVPIDSLQHALATVGARRLERWLSLLVGSVANATPAALRLNRSAQMRGRMLELMGIGYLEGADLANLFLVGAFSMLPSMLMQPMACAIASLALPEGVADALLSRHGRYGAVLESAEVLESGGDADLLSSGLNMPQQTAATGTQSTDPNAACKGPDDSSFPRFMV